MAKYFTTWGFPHDGRKKPVLLLGPEKERSEHQSLFQHACESRANPDFQRIDVLCSTGGVTKKKRFEKGAYKPRESTLPPVETPETPVIPSQEGAGSANAGTAPVTTTPPPGPDDPTGGSEDAPAGDSEDTPGASGDADGGEEE